MKKGRYAEDITMSDLGKAITNGGMWTTGHGMIKASSSSQSNTTDVQISYSSGPLLIQNQEEGGLL